MEESKIKARLNWIKASKNLKFEIVSPYIFDKDFEEAFAFFPCHGSPNGIIVDLIYPPDYNTNKNIINWATRNKLRYSFINLVNFLEYNEDRIKDCLIDWGHFIPN